MKFLLTIKHWQLFLLSWGPALLMKFFTGSDFDAELKLLPLSIMLTAIVSFFWIWSIVGLLQHRLPAEHNLKITRFRIMLLIPTIYIILISSLLGFSFYARNFNVFSYAWFNVTLVILHLLSMLFIFLSIRFAAKILKSVELGRMVKFNDYAGEFFLLWMAPIGIWILQPRLNKLIEESSTQVL